jgi:hypothetical protein
LEAQFLQFTEPNVILVDLSDLKNLGVYRATGEAIAAAYQKLTEENGVVTLATLDHEVLGSVHPMIS